MERDGENGANGVDPQAAAQLEELHRQLVAREELRAQNALEVVVPLRVQIASGAVKLKSDIKKSSAFVKKLKMLTENNAESVMKDIVELNLTRYVSECVSSIAEAPLKLADLPAAVKVASLLHQRYEDFTATMVQTLVAVFDASYGADDKTKIVKRRIILRLLSELYLAGVYDDANVIVAIIQRVARREGGAPSKSRQKGNMNMGSAGAGSGSSAQLEVPLLVSFAKAVGVEFLGVRPKKFKDLETQLGDKFQSLMEKIHDLVPSAVQKESLACFSEAYEMICKFYLAQHAAFVKLEARNEREEANRGEVSDQHVQELENAKLLFDKLQTSVNALADALDREVPPLPLERDDDGLNGGGILVWEGDGSSRVMRADSPFDDEDTRAFYEDLPDLLELVPAVVLGLTEADLAELKKKKEATAAAPSAAEEEAEVENEADAEGDADDGEVEGDAEEESPLEDGGTDGRERTESQEAGREGELKQQQPQDSVSSATPAGTSSSAATTATTAGGSSTTAAGYHHQHDSFFSSLEDLVNRDRCDKAAVDFCYRNSKANRNRLIKTLFSVPRTHLELLPYYSRLVATLQSVFKEDIGGELVNLLVNEFTHHIKKRNQFRLESKIKNIRFLAELVKFKICPPNVGFRCLKKCFSDFQGHNVLVATTFLENCGRFLYCSKHTHVRTENFLSIMMKLKSAKNLDPQAETLVQNAYYMCKPPDRVERAVKQYEPLYLFIMKCLYQDLNDANSNKVVKTLRKLPWQEKSTTAHMLKAILKVTKGKVMHMKLICDVVKGLSRYHDEIGVLLIDEVLEIIRRGLQINDYRDHQHSLGVIKLLGELYNCALVNMNVVLETLYLVIHHSHDLLTLPEYSGNTPPSSATAASISPANIQDIKRRFLLVPDMRYDPRVPSSVDGPTEVFRIRLVCALIEACNGSGSSGGPSSGSGSASQGERGISKARLGRFMVFFQRYIFSKTEIPLETDFVVVDLFEALAVSLKDHFKKFETWEEADAAAQTILRGDLEEAERRFAKKNAALAAANPERTRDSFGDAGIVPLSRAGEEDEDEDDDDDESDDDDDDDEDDEERACGDEDGEGDEEDDDDDDDEDDEDDDEDDDDDDDDEEEEEEEQLIIHDRVQKTEEDDAFEKAFKSMMQSSADSRKLAGRVNVDKMAIPTVVKSTGPPPVDPSSGAAGGAGTGSASPFGANGPQGVVFRMLRRGNKGKVEARQLIVPEESSLAQHSHRQENAGKKEMSELKRLVLQNIEREDFDSGLDVPPVFTIAPRPSNQAQAQQQSALPPRDLNRSGYGIGSEWNNDEFGLRRGRGYRGQK